MPSTASGDLWDTIIVGGGSAGLSAAVALGRARRRVLVIDSGKPRNRFADHMHTVLGHEGLPPTGLLERGRQEAASYGADFYSGNVSAVRETTAASAPKTLAVTCQDGTQLFTRSVIAASGLTDRLPEIPGLAERWGKSVLHCPYCHGWEVRGQRIAVLAASPMALHQAELLRQWTEDLTFLSAGAGQLEDATVRRLQARGVVVETTPAVEVRGSGTALSEVALEDGRTVPVDAIFTFGQALPHDGYLAALNLDRADTPMGSFLQTDQTGRTSHDRVWAAGNVTNPAANVPMSISAGTFAGAQVNMTLVTEDFDLAEAAR